MLKNKFFEAEYILSSIFSRPEKNILEVIQNFEVIEMYIVNTIQKSKITSYNNSVFF